MSNERLERIKERVNYHSHLDDDIEWLIKQAERVEELERELEAVDRQDEQWKELIRIAMTWKNIYEKESKRFKQALEFYANEKNYERAYDDEVLFDYLPSEIDFDNGEKARKALEREGR